MIEPVPPIPTDGAEQVRFTERFLATVVEPEREVLSRIAFNHSAITLSTFEPKLQAAADKMVLGGWLRIETEHIIGTHTYKRYQSTIKLDPGALHRWYMKRERASE